ncbi:hypothetical protein Poli38472_000157 [Pythium oligandrum]|uniref:EF-hand domain-containing protein n=1 Tax=Pythium oligandrum TaxID=41045 RepID=A0A8K1CBK8_PYTOL|nr:hypothetical protein Poli38472_000157 [Pythium oligandrum]|eukprot:TMW60115.1 hypothetical protein Poli38472_000157 [Pythium oligandrum]
MEDDDDDEQSHENADRVSLYVLEERRREIKAGLRVVINSLREVGAVSNGYDAAYYLEPPPPEYPHATIHSRLFRRRVVAIDEVAYRKQCDERFAFDLPDRFRVEWAISDLGREKCRVIWQRFDLDKDGGWNHDEFVDYIDALEGGSSARPDLHAFADHPEVWRMVMSDLHELDTSQCISFDAFLRYRESIEEDFPLASDLKALGISTEWRVVEQSQRMLQLSREYADKDGIVAIKHLQFLLAECGFPVTYQELWQSVKQQRYFHRCHRSVLARKRALRLFGYRQPTAFQLTNPALEDEPRVCQAGVRTLLFSGWEPSERTRWRGHCLRARLGLYAVLRRTRRDVANWFSWVRRVASTGLLRATCLQSTPEDELGDYVFKLEVGPGFSTRSAIHLSYYSDADSAATLHELHYLERGAECFVYFDLFCRSGTRDTDTIWLSQRLTWFLETYFRDHFELLPFMFKWFVTIPTKRQLRSGNGGGSAGHTSNTPVIRLVILFTGEMDLYEVMQSLNLPSSMQFDHLLQRFSTRWLFSHSLEDILTNKRFVAGTQLGCRGQMDVRFNRRAWGQILSQCARQMGDRQVLAREEQVYVRELQHKQNPSELPRKTGETTVKSVPVVETSVQIDQSSSVTSWLFRLGVWLRSTKELSVTWTFNSLAEVITEYAWIRSILSIERVDFFQQLLMGPGGLAAYWKDVGDSFRAEFATSRFVQSAMASVAVSTASAPRPITRISSKSSVMSEDRNFGLEHSIAASFPFASPVSTPAEKVKHSARSSVPQMDGNQDNPEEDTSPSKGDPVETELLEFYEACAKNLLSVGAIRAEAGTSGVSCVLEGWNVFSVLPRVLPTAAVRQTAMTRVRSNNSTASAAGSAHPPGLSRRGSRIDGSPL